ncbi:hypothetical protein MAR_029003 [Mya arenaria]|uniref:Uncharacterized protein n=1 Tax=Mya arenaria TaxID=6604 RepID=A0ABY7DJP6_MYAAR|nr:hypothetical protein MAR_029003 [Mya arenaria]
MTSSVSVGGKMAQSWGWTTLIILGNSMKLQRYKRTCLLSNDEHTIIRSVFGRRSFIKPSKTPSDNVYLIEHTCYVPAIIRKTQADTWKTSLDIPKRKGDEKKLIYKVCLYQRT